MRYLLGTYIMPKINPWTCMHNYFVGLDAYRLASQSFMYIHAMHADWPIWAFACP